MCSVYCVVCSVQCVVCSVFSCLTCAPYHLSLQASPLCHLAKPPSFARKQSEQTGERRGSYSDQTQASLARREGSLSRRGSGAGYDSLPRRGSGAGLERRGSSARRKSEDIDPAELQRRRLSEAGLRRPSATDVVLNEATGEFSHGGKERVLKSSCCTELIVTSPVIYL